MVFAFMICHYDHLNCLTKANEVLLEFPVDISAMTQVEDQDNELPTIDVIDHPVGTDPNSVLPLAALTGLFLRVFPVAKLSGVVLVCHNPSPFLGRRPTLGPSTVLTSRPQKHHTIVSSM